CSRRASCGTRRQRCRIQPRPWSCPRVDRCVVISRHSGRDACKTDCSFDDKARPTLHLCVCLAEILSQHANTKNLDPSEEVNRQHDRCPTRKRATAEPCPERPSTDAHCADKHREADECNEPQRYQRKRRNR